MSDTGVRTVVQGMVFGSIVLLGFSARIVALFSSRKDGQRKKVRQCASADLVRLCERAGLSRT